MVNDIFFIISHVLLLVQQKIIQSLTKSPIYFKEEKLNFTCWLLNHDPELAGSDPTIVIFCLLERLEVFFCFHWRVVGRLVIRVGFTAW